MTYDLLRLICDKVEYPQKCLLLGRQMAIGAAKLCYELFSDSKA
ncbi:MAG: hypothetical protein V1859_10845 [archaeon]